MVGGIDKQIYLPYKLADQLGFYKKYGVNVELSTEIDGGVGAEDAMASGQVDMAGAWYNHTIDFQVKGKTVIDIVQLSGAPGEREMCAHQQRRALGRRLRRQDARRHRPRFGHRLAHQVPRRAEGHQELAIHRSPSAPARRRSPRSRAVTPPAS